MSRGIRRNRRFRQDLIDIYAYIHERSPQAAERVLNAIERYTQLLLDMPGIGRRWASPDPRLEGMRLAVVTPYCNYLIFFRPTRDGIEVLRVVHGARELQNIIDEIEADLDEA